MRGQVHVLEAITASLLLLASVIFALQITAVTPLSASTSSQHIENQQQASAEGALSSAIENGSLRKSVLYWNSTGSRFWGASDDGYYVGDPVPTEFGRILERTFTDRGIAYNVNVIYGQGGVQVTRRMVYRGVPSDNAVSASRTVTLSDGTRLYEEDLTRSSTTVGETDFYADDVSSSELYAVVRVEVVVWRI